MHDVGITLKRTEYYPYKELTTIFKINRLRLVKLDIMSGLEVRFNRTGLYLSLIKVLFQLSFTKRNLEI